MKLFKNKKDKKPIRVKVKEIRKSYGSTFIIWEEEDTGITFETDDQLTWNNNKCLVYTIRLAYDRAYEEREIEYFRQGYINGKWWLIL